MANLSMMQILQHAYSAGWRGSDLIVAGAVAKAESGGNPNANAVNSKEDSRGLWQINVKAHPEQANTNLYDPATNAQVAHALWAQSGWGPWSAHNNKSYLLFMPEATAVAPSVAVIGGVGDKYEETKDAVSNNPIVEALRGPAAVVEWLKKPNTWKRIIMVTSGFAGALIGVAILVASSKTVTEPVGKVVKLVGKVV